MPMEGSASLQSPERKKHKYVDHWTATQRQVLQRIQEVERRLNDFDEKQISDAMNECSLEDMRLFFRDNSTAAELPNQSHMNHTISVQSISVGASPNLNKSPFK